MTVLVLVFAEVLPKTLAILRSDDVARFLSGPTLIVVKIFGPIIWAIQWFVRRTLGLFGIKLDMEMDVLAAHEEIRGAVEYHHSEGLVEARDRRMLGGVLDLSEMDVSQVMVHRMSIAMVDAGLVIHEAQTIPKIGQAFIFHGHRFQVVKRVRNRITALKISAPLDGAETA